MKARSLYWSVRRELWENRSTYLAPLAVAALFLLGFMIRALTLPSRMRAVSALGAAEQRAAVGQPYVFSAGLIMVTAFIVGIFYCLEALHAERRDRSILFWKSLPVSDLTTVLSKAVIPLVLLQLTAFAITVATHAIVFALSAAVLLASGLDIGMLWAHVSFQMWSMLLYHFVTVHALWHAPIYGWLLLVSAWARRAVFLWAVLPLVAIAFVEKIAFGSSHFVSVLQHRVAGPEAFNLDMTGADAMHPMAALDPVRFVGAPGLWIGLVFTAACLAVAARLRRRREPI